MSQLDAKEHGPNGGLRSLPRPSHSGKAFIQFCMKIRLCFAVFVSFQEPQLYPSPLGPVGLQ